MHKCNHNIVTNANPSQITQSCYRLSRELMEKETKLKERIAELRISLEHAKEKKRAVSTQKDNISKGKKLKRSASLVTVLFLSWFTSGQSQRAKSFRNYRLKY